MEKKRTMRYTDAELSVIKNTFAENDELLFAIRKVLMQLPLDPVDMSLIEGHVYKKNNVTDVLRKTILPTIDGNAPFNQVLDLFQTVAIEDKTPDIAYLHLKSREKLINYLDNILESLEKGTIVDNTKFSEMSVLEGKDADEVWVDMKTRKDLMAHIEFQLSMLSILAGQKEETVEQTKARLEKNSNK